MKKLLILGAGAHGKVVSEAAELENKWDEIAFLDDRTDVKKILDFNIIGKLEDYKKYIDEYKFAFAAIGDNKTRLQWIQRIMDAGYDIPVIIHPKSCVSRYCDIKEGTVILPGAVVNTGTSIGKGCIININSCVDHDCQIGDGVHICSGAVVRSMAKIGKLSYIGAGACVKFGSNIPEDAVLEDREVFEYR